MSISYWLDHSAKSPKKNYDFVIVGGGIAGLSAVYWLQKENPNYKIAILEKNRIGFGASGRNAGFVTCGSAAHFLKLHERFGISKAVEIWKFSEQNRKLLQEHIIEDRAAEVDFSQTGSCTIADGDEQWATFRATAEIMKSHQINVQEIDSNQVLKDYGVSGISGGISGGIEYKGDGVIHPVKLLTLLKSKLRADIYESTEVFAIEDQPGSLQEIKTDQGIFATPKILLTLNAYLPLVLKNFKDLVIPHRGQVLVTEPLPQMVKGPCYFTKNLCYFRQLPQGNLLVGGFRNISIETENSLLDQTTDVIQEALLRFIKDHFTQGPSAKISHQWSGIMGFTPDEQMLIGSLPQNPAIHLMAGCSGHGMGLSFHAAKVLVESLFGRPVPAHLDVQRFV